MIFIIKCYHVCCYIYEDVTTISIRRAIIIFFDILSTLNSFTSRYKPFFIKTDPGQLDLDDSELIAQGQLEVSCVEATRLAALPGVQSVYCTITAGKCLNT